METGKAAAYLRDTEVVVWTPRLTTGRPLSFAPLASLGDVADDPDEFEIALDNAVASIVPRSGLPGSGARLSQGRAVLKEALRAYVQRGSGDPTCHSMRSTRVLRTGHGRWPSVGKTTCTGIRPDSWGTPSW